MSYFYLKALHIIFIVTWFSAMFYIVRLFIYATEALEKPEPARGILQSQLNRMAKRLWYGIGWPSAILTLLFGPAVLWQGGYLENFSAHSWLHIKLGFVVLLYLYFGSLHYIFRRIQDGSYLWSSTRLRLWNEVATLLLVAIVMLAVVKQSMSWVWGLTGLLLLAFALLAAIRLYKNLRDRKVS